MCYKIAKAREAVEVAFQGYFRTGGAPFYTHPFQVQEILAELRTPKYVQIAGLLHDCVEDNTCLNRIEIVNKFGKNVARLVEGVTKDEKKNYYKKLVIYTNKNPWTIIIKMADRIHNLKTVGCFNEKRKIKYYRETTEILMPLFACVSNQLPERQYRVYSRLRQSLEELVSNYYK